SNNGTTLVLSDYKTGPPPEIAVAPESLNFGAVVVGEVKTQVFQLVNAGGHILNGTATVFDPYAVVSGSPFHVIAGQTGSVAVSFAPSSEAEYNSIMTISSDGGNSTNVVKGTGAFVPVPAFTGNPLTGVVPHTVEFQDTSSGTIINRYWVFGDG